jgi:hypothetical protein
LHTPGHPRFWVSGPNAISRQLHRPIVTDCRSDDERVADDGRWRRNSVINPFVDFGADITTQINLAVHAEVGARFAVFSVECDQARIERTDKNTMPADRTFLGRPINPGSDAAVRDLGMVQCPVDLRIESPDLFAGFWVQCKNDSTAGREIKSPLDKYRVCFERKWFPMPLAEFAGPESPKFLKALDVLRCDMRQGRKLQAVLAATVMCPLIVCFGVRRPDPIADARMIRIGTVRIIK